MAKATFRAHDEGVVSEFEVKFQVEMPSRRSVTSEVVTCAKFFSAGIKKGDVSLCQRIVGNSVYAPRCIAKRVVEALKGVWGLTSRRV